MKLAAIAALCAVAHRSPLDQVTFADLSRLADDAPAIEVPEPAPEATATTATAQPAQSIDYAKLAAEIVKAQSAAPAPTSSTASAPASSTATG